MAALDPGAKAPPIMLPDRDSSAEHAPAWERLTLLAFYKVTCPVCQMAMPYVERYRNYEAAGLELLSVVEDPAEAARDFAQEYGVTLPAALDLPPYRASAAYGLTNVPTLFLVEPGGRVVRNQVSFSKDGYNAISRDIAERLGVDAREICPPDDGNPPFRPG